MPSVGERPPESGRFHERNILALIRETIKRSYFELSTLLTLFKTVNELIIFSHRQWSKYASETEKWMGNFIVLRNEYTIPY